MPNDIPSGISPDDPARTARVNPRLFRAMTGGPPIQGGIAENSGELMRQLQARPQNGPEVWVDTRTGQ